MTRGSAVILRLCRRNILWLVGALMLVIVFHLYFIKGIKTITTRENDHFPPVPKEFLSPSHTKVSMNRLYHYSLERAVNSPSKFLEWKLRLLLREMSIHCEAQFSSK